MRKRQLRSGIRWAYDKTVKGTRLFSPYIYLSRGQAEWDEAQVARHYRLTGELLEPWKEDGHQSETVLTLYARWVRWLRLHRSPRHASDMQSLIKRALAHAPELADLPAVKLTVDQVEKWAERWAGDLVEEGKGRGEVNKWLVASQTAWSGPWGKRRSEPEYHFNPFKYIDRFRIQKSAKYVPTVAQVNKIRMAADGEFRLYLEILIETGARPSEGLALTWAEVHPTSVILYTKKTGSGDRLPRRVDISDDLRGRFDSWRRTRGPGTLYVFQQDDAPAPRGYNWAKVCHVKTCRLAKVDYFSTGCYRHYHAVSLYAQTKDVLAVQRRLGHTNIRTTQRYLASLTGV